MHAEIEAMTKAYNSGLNSGLRGGSGELTIDGLEACARGKGDIKTVARALELEELTVYNNGKTIVFSGEDLT